MNNDILDQFFILTSPVPDPIEDALVPHKAVLAVQNPVALVGKVQEPRGHPQALQDVEEHHALGNGQTEVKVIVHHKLRCAEVISVVDWVPPLVVVAVVPDGPVLVLLDEPQLLGAIGPDLVQLAVVCDDGFEFAAEIVTLDPICPGVILLVRALGEGLRMLT